MPSQFFPGQFEQLDAIREFVGEGAQRAGMDAREIYAVQLAVDEACSNIIEHAYEGVADGQINCVYTAENGILTIMLQDWGTPFDPSDIPDPNINASLDERRVGGLGIFLMRNLMDEMYYKSLPDGSNQLTMVKRKAGVSKPPQDKTKKPDWRTLLGLGDQIISASSMVEQRDLIIAMASQLVEGEVTLWLDETIFRLPDWREPLFTPEPPYEAMRKAFESGRVYRADRNGLVIAIPIENRETVMGVLQVRRASGPRFKRRDVDLLEGLASHAAVALLAWHRIVVENWRTGQLALVRQVSAQIANATSLDELAVRVTQLIQHTFHYYYVAIFTLDPGSNELNFRASASMSQREGQTPPVLHVQLNQGLIGYAASTGQEILCNDAEKEPLFRHIDSLPETQSEVAIPLKMEDQVLGVLDVQSDSLDAFHPYDLLVLRALADNIAVAVEGARLYSNLSRRASQLAVITEVGRSITSILDLRQMMEVVALLLFRRFGYSHVHLFTVHPNRRQVHYEAGSGPKSAALEGYALSLDDPDGIIPYVARSGETVLANDVSLEPHYRPSPLPPSNTLSELAVAMKYGKQVVGVLDVQSDQLNAFSTDDVLLFEALSDYIAAAIHNADLYRTEQWRRQVSDSLREVAGLLSANASLDQVLDAILTELERNLPSDVASIWLLDENDISCAAVHGANIADVEAARNNPEAALMLTRALLARQPIIRKPDDPCGPSAMASGFAPDHSSIAAPLIIGDQAVGVLALVHHTSGRYGHEAQAIVTTFASYAAVAIENTRLYDSTQEQAYASAALLQVAEAVVSLSDLDEILATIVRILPILVGVERAAIYRWDGDLEQLCPVQQYELPEEALPQLWRNQNLEDFPLLTAALESDGPVVSAESYLDPQEWPKILPPSEDELPDLLQTDERLLMAFPIAIKDVIFGVLLAEEASGGRRFRSRRIEILTGVAQQAALAIQNDLFQQEMRIRERLEMEVQLARQIQHTLIPDTLPEYPFWDLSSRWRTARQVGGDFFDVLTLPDNKIGLFIADVADKGMPAALFMVLTRTLIRAAVIESSSPSVVLKRVNALLYPDADQGMFVTAVYAVLDMETGVLTYANAGHNPPLWVRTGDEVQVERLTRTGMALGIMEDLEIDERAIGLAPNDSLLLYTDGLTEAFDIYNTMFGEERLFGILDTFGKKAESKKSSDLLNEIEAQLDKFIGSNPQSDDLTLLAVKRAG